MNRRRILAAVLASAPLALAPVGAQAQDLEIMGPVTREVRLVGGAGELSVALTNDGRRALRPAVRFVRSDGSRVLTLTVATAVDDLDLDVAGPVGALAPLEPRETRELRFRLHVAEGDGPEALDGRLEIRARRGGRPAGVDVRGRPADLSFDPPQLSLAVSQACWRLLSRCGDATEIVVRGRDALRWAKSARGPLGTAVLHSGRGGNLRLRLDRPTVRDGTVTARVTAENLSLAGRYAGELPLDATALAGPVLMVDAKVRWSLGSAVAAVFLGALLGGFFLRRFEIRRRRRLLEIELISALNRYDAERGRHERVHSFDLDSQLEPRRQKVEAYPGTRGVSALLWHIQNATDDEDFDEDVERTHALIATIERWLALEPVARDAAELLEDAQPDARISPVTHRETTFSECQSYLDLARLRIRATRTPDDDGDCKGLIQSLVAQCLIVSKSKVIWALLAELEGREGISLEHGSLMHDLDLASLESRFAPQHERTPEDSEELRLTLEDAENKLRRLHDDVDAVVSKGETAVQARRIATDIEGKRGKPAIDRQLPDVSARRIRLQSAVNRLAVRSVLWTLARALVAAVAYTLLIYSDTWGSETDFASAFATGFLTETLVNWAVLPAFRSIRPRRGPTRAADAPEALTLPVVQSNGSPSAEPLVQGRPR